MQAPIRLVLAIPDRLHRQALHCLLDLNRRFEVAAAASDHDDVTRVVEDIQPDVLVIDDRMSGCGIVPRIRELVARGFIKIVCLTSTTNNDYIRHLMFMGVGACVSRNADAGTLYTAVLRVKRGETYISADLGRYLVNGSRRQSAMRPNHLSGPGTLGSVN